MLYNKYRPGNISEIQGQEHVCNIITNGIKNSNLPNGIILTGDRGTGKTSIARIIAKMLQCENNCCNECNTCLAINASIHADVIEIDAASKSNINEIRSIIEESKHYPIKSKNKVFIIDECHMLTKQSSNALLKTLEEPLENVYFIFATTEADKIISTIVSRCISLRLNRISENEITNQILSICEKENAVCEANCAKQIAFASQGSLRDAIVILEQAIIINNKEITIENVQKIIGNQDYVLLNKLIESVFARDINTSIDLARKLIASGVLATKIVKHIMQYTHKKITSEHSKTPLYIRIWQILVKSYDECEKEYANIAIEMMVIKLCVASILPTSTEILNQNESNSKKIGHLAEGFNIEYES